jgi:hypothetical protein
MSRVRQEEILLGGSEASMGARARDQNFGSNSGVEANQGKGTHSETYLRTLRISLEEAVREREEAKV